MFMVLGVTESLISAFLNVVVGAYSDRYGRKSILIFSFTGATIYFGVLCFLQILSKYMKISPWVLGMSIIIFVGSGGLSAIIGAVLSHTSDSTTEKNRSKRLTVIQSTFSLGVLMGALFSSIVFNYLSTLQIFSISFLSLLLATLYVRIFIEETVKVYDDHSLWVRILLFKFCKFF